MALKIRKRIDKLYRDAHIFAVRLSRDLFVDLLKDSFPNLNSLRAVQDILSLHLTEISLFSHYLGYYKALERAKKHFAKGLGPYESAISFMKRRLKTTEGESALLKAKYGVNATRVAGAWGKGIEKKLQKVSEEIVRENLHVKEGIRRFETVVKGAANSWQIETAVRTQIQIAYGAGRWDANQSPAIQEILWGYRYITAGDFRVRPSHEALENTELPKEDPTWNSIWPPNGYNCRCDILEIYFDEVHKVVPIKKSVIINREKVIPGPDKNWNLNHGRIFESTLNKTETEVIEIV